MTTLSLTYDQLDDLSPLRQQAGQNGVVVGELVGGRFECRVVPSLLAREIRNVISQFVNKEDRQTGTKTQQSSPDSQLPRHE